MEQLGRHPEMLKATARDVPDRQRTLLATLDWSYSLLSRIERAVLRRLSVFAGSFGLESAVVVATADDVRDIDALDAISTLVEMSLVQIEGLDDPRYRLLETMRHFAAEQLAAQGETAAAEERHGAAMMKVATQAEGATWHKSDRDWVTTYTRDYADLEAALRRASARQEIDVAAAAGVVLMRIDFMRDIEFGAVDRLSLLMPLLPAAAPQARSRILDCVCQVGDLPWPQIDRVEMSAQRVEAFKQIGRLAAAHNRLGFWHVNELLAAGRFDDAMNALEAARKMNDPTWPPRTRVIRMAGETLPLLYRFDEAQARQKCRQVAAEYEEHGLTTGATRVRGWLARLLYVTDNLDEAIHLLEQSSVEVKEQPGHYRIVLATLSAAKARKGNLDVARDLALLWIEQSRPIASAFGCEHLAYVLACLGHATAASQILGLSDAYSAFHKRVRMVPEAWSAERAAELAQDSIGQGRMETLRREGASLEWAACLELASDALISQDS
jgi:hypothetical protein